MTKIKVKICGLTRPEDIAACVDAGAAYAGFNFFPKSPRYVDPIQASSLASLAPESLSKVALVVNAEDDLIEQIVSEVPLDMLQLHGSETPERVAEIRTRFGLPVMKVLGVATEADLAPLDAYSAVSDQLLIDAKAPKGAVLPGGNGITFDWKLVAKLQFSKPWMLAGGLTDLNVAEAVAKTGVVQVDAASGIESAPGVKDAGKIARFVAAAQNAQPQ